MKKRNYSNEFKLEAVRLNYKRDNIKDLANELGVQVQRIYKCRATNKETQLELEILKKAVHIFSKSDGKFIASYKHLYPVEKMCSVFKVSRSGYYRWFCDSSNRALENSLFTYFIRNIFDSRKLM